MSRTATHSIMTALVVATLAIVVIIAARSVWAVDPAQLDDFEDGTTMGWTEGAPSPNPPINVPTSGPGGAGDAYLENSSAGGNGAGSRMAMFNQSQWTGDFSSAGVTSVKADLINLGADPLPVRVAVEGDAGGRYASTSAAVLPADATWYSVVFELSDAEVTNVGGTQSLASVLTNVTELRILASSSPAWQGDSMVATIGMDNLAVGSVIFIDGFESGDVARWSSAVVPGDASTAVRAIR
jgi:nitrogen fixation-related uncharacterized protein